MATIVNNPPPSNNSGGPMGMIIIVIVLLVLAILGYVYVLPAIQNIQSPQVNIPSEIDVNINQTK